MCYFLKEKINYFICRSVLLIKKREILFFFLNIAATISPNNNLTTSVFLQSIAYVIPHVILTEPRILFTYLNFLLYKKACHLNTMLQSLKKHTNTQMLRKISNYHMQICITASKLQQCLKVQIALVFVKAFQDVLAAFYATMMRNEGYLKVIQYAFRGILAIFELFLLISPVEKTITMVSSKIIFTDKFKVIIVLS